jgi:hypothetical protein
LARGKLGKSDTKKLSKLVAEAVADRRRLNCRAAQERLLRSVREKAESFRASLAKVAPVCHARRRTLVDITAAVQEASRDLTTMLHEAARRLRERAAAVDFRADFGAFVQQSKVIRYDMVCEDFVPVDVSHPVFADIDTRLHVEVLPIYPVGIARVVDDFVADRTDQISVGAGKYVLLMETITEGWVFVSNPFTRAMGYIPGRCVEAVGRALALVVKAPNGLGDNVYVQLGDYVAVTHGEEEFKYNVITTRGEELVHAEGHPRDHR